MPLSATPVTGGTGIAHTRWATHGKVTADNAHPHLSSSAEADQSVCLVHNGIIENHTALRAELQELGYEFSRKPTQKSSCTSFTTTSLSNLIC